jgi:hypothetical protein
VTSATRIVLNWQVSRCRHLRFARVVAGAHLAALRTHQRRVELGAHADADFAGLQVQLHVTNLPGVDEAENAGVEVADR